MTSACPYCMLVGDDKYADVTGQFLLTKVIVLYYNP